LQSYPKTLLLVSHDRAFLNEVCTDIIHMDAQKLNYYKGDFNSFEVVRAELLKNQRRAYEADQAKRAHMQASCALSLPYEFIDKFRTNAKRASLVQSRIKALEKMEKVAEVADESLFSFKLPDPAPLSRPVLAIEGVSFGYDSSKILFNDVHFGVDLGSRIGILGPNGAGKSTLLNLILDKGIVPMRGIVKRHANLKLGSFTQHHAEQFDYRLNAVENMLKMFGGTQGSGLNTKKGLEEQDARSFLGQFAITGPLALQPLKFLSGGQKSRVAFAALAYSKPDILLLDEPTNHLDVNTCDALVDALKSYKGGIMVVSHDQHFISNVCDELWVVGSGKCRRYPGDFDSYKQDIIAQRKAKH
ncbi:unnamed protein product, partial [Chrysoparadoxa australica]